MPETDDKIRTGFYIEKDILKQMDDNLTKADCRSRNEFANRAIEFYLGYLRCADDSKYLTPALESVISGTVKDTENRISRMMFKLSVEMSMMMHVIASSLEIDTSTLDRLRGKCVKDVKKSIGSLNFDDAVIYQRGVAPGGDD